MFRALSRSPARDEAQTASVLGAVEAAAAAPAVSATRPARAAPINFKIMEFSRSFLCWLPDTCDSCPAASSSPARPTLAQPPAFA